MVYHELENHFKDEAAEVNGSTITSFCTDMTRLASQKKLLALMSEKEAWDH